MNVTVAYKRLEMTRHNVIHSCVGEPLKLNVRPLMKIQIIVSGIPTSGKSTVGRAIATALRLAMLDKDDYSAGTP